MRNTREYHLRQKGALVKGEEVRLCVCVWKGVWGDGPAGQGGGGGRAAAVMAAAQPPWRAKLVCREGGP